MMRNTRLSTDDLLLAPGAMFACLPRPTRFSCVALLEDLMEGSDQYSERNKILSETRNYPDPKVALVGLSTLRLEPVGPSIRGMNSELARWSAG